MFSKVDSKVDSKSSDDKLCFGVFRPKYTDEEFPDDCDVDGNSIVKNEFKEYVMRTPGIDWVSCIIINTGFTYNLVKKVIVEKKSEEHTFNMVYGSKPDSYKIEELYNNTGRTEEGLKNGDVVFFPQEGKDSFHSFEVMDKLSELSWYMYCEDCRPYWISTVEWVVKNGKLVAVCNVSCSE